MVSVSEITENALSKKTGAFYPILSMIESYECADWLTVSRLVIVHSLDSDALTEAYMDAMLWYKQIISAVDEPEEPAAQ